MQLRAKPHRRRKPYRIFDRRVSLRPYPRKRRTPAQRRKHAAAERKRYATLKAGLVRAIADANGMGQPACNMPLVNGRQCENYGDLEIDHKHFSRFTQRKMNSVQRLERFAIEFIRWMGGEEKCELRLACRTCNARHQPKKRAQ